MSRAGFVAVLNHGIDADVIDKLDKAARDFFTKAAGESRLRPVH
jgi:isopenicillin N synthase-like dioxygenase